MSPRLVGDVYANEAARISSCIACGGVSSERPGYESTFALVTNNWLAERDVAFEMRAKYAASKAIPFRNKLFIQLL